MRLPLVVFLLAAEAAAQQAAEPLVIRARRWPESARRGARTSSTVNREELLRAMPKNPAEALREEPGVMIQQTMPGRASVSIRGLIGKDNLVLVDGARLNNAATENIQSLSSIDPETIGAVEVLRGPGSVLYGGDALGGVVYIVPRRRQGFLPGSRHGGRISSTYRSADEGMLGRFEISGNRGNFGYLAGASVMNFGDLDQGRGLGTARPTAYRAQAADLALDLNHGETAWRLTYQHMLQAQVPRYDQYSNARRYAAAGGFTELHFDPDKRDLLVAEAKAESLAGPASELEVKGYWHRQERGTNQRRTNSNIREEYSDVVHTFGLRAEALSEPHPSFKMLYGLEGHEDRVAASRTDLHIHTGFRSPNDANSTYPDGSRFSSVGFFLLNQWDPAAAWRLEAGGRFTESWTHTKFRAGAFAGTPFDDAYRSWTGGAAASWQALESLGVTANVWQGFRPPNLNDTAALKTAPSGIDVPSSGLGAEKSLGFEFALRHRTGPVRQSLAFFHSILSDRIERIPGTFNGAAVLNGAPVFKRANTGGGYIQGLEWEGSAEIGWDLAARANVAWLYGRDTAARTAMTRMPPAMGLACLRWERRELRSAWAETFVRMAGRQRRISPADRADPRINPAGSPAWATWNWRGGLSPTPSTRLILAVENVLDAAYREHASGVDAPGFNAILNAQWLF